MTDQQQQQDTPGPGPGPPRSGALATIIDADKGFETTVLLARGAEGYEEPGAPEGDSASGGPVIRVPLGEPGRELVLRPSAKLLDERVLEPPCPACGCKFLYGQRDFNRGLGIGIVAAAAAIGLVWSAITGDIYPLLWCLAGATAFDSIIYAIMPNVAVCYRCLTSYRNVEMGEGIDNYDQEIADGFIFSGGALGSGYRHGGGEGADGGGEERKEG